MNQFQFNCDQTSIHITRKYQKAKFAKNLGNFGNYLGIAFQIMDDYLDYAADTKKLGKNIGDDFAERKITLPIIKLKLYLFPKKTEEHCAYLAKLGVR